MPTYKDKGGLRRAVLSVINQTYTNIELFVVDDNSPDSVWRKHTEQVMSEFNDYPNVFYLKHEVNKNGAAARNTGIHASHGEYIAFLDDDDWFLPEKIAKQILYLDNYPEFEGVYNFALREDKPINTHPYEGDNSKPLLMMQTHMFTPSLCFRADAIKAINGFDESFRRHQDYEMLLRFFAAGYRIGCLQEYLTGLCVNSGQNIPSVEKQLELKSYFFSKFGEIIEKLSEDDKSFKKQVYSSHYGNVFWYALKAGKIRICAKLFANYVLLSPSTFLSPSINGICSFVKRRIKKS